MAGMMEFSTSVKEVCAAQAKQEAAEPVILRRGAEIVGVIYRLRELVDTHSFPASPFPIGHLLKNAVLASQLALGASCLEGGWLALRSHQGELVAHLAITEAPLLPTQMAAASLAA